MTADEFKRLARAYGVWTEPQPDPVEPEAEGHGDSPPRRRPGRPRKSPDNPSVDGPALSDSDVA